MLKRALNLPFKALGKVARAVQAREAEKQAAVDARRPQQEAEVRAKRDNIPGYDVPDDFDPGQVERKARDVVGWLSAGQAVHFVDVRARRTLCIPGSQHLPLHSLGIELAELPPAGQPLVVYCDDGEASARAVRFLRFRGIDDAVLLAGGLSAWQSAKGPVEPAPESR